MTDSFPLLDLLGIDLEPLEPGRSRARVEVGPDALNPNGVAHGGVLFTAVDTAMGAAVASLLGPEGRCASVEVHIRFLEPAGVEPLEVVAEVTRPGRSLMHVAAEVTRAGGVVVATATATFAVTTG